ncbi:hypothetical protein GCM10023321_47850 [Pseudonocardia eucalypti]|uniref:Uncharacterized protein n=1 Tax=Pseudonocardia eucalypti TaxID=648755 RepID=A0ABP9QIB1_9PSEU|nr:hypothetical protein [Pseudonocardia eucalypti]
MTGAPGVSAELTRRGLLLLTALGIGATAFELATERHWNGLAQLIPWVTLGVLALGVALAALAGERGTLTVRVLASVVLVASVYGIFEHASANHASGPLDQAHAEVWDTLPAVTQWWYAVTKTVGPAPPLAPGVLGQQALLLLLATCIPTRPNSSARGAVRPRARRR